MLPTVARRLAMQVTFITLAMRWNGTDWAIASSPNPTGAMNSLLNGVSCTSTTDCFAVGNFYGISPGGQDRYLIAPYRHYRGDDDLLAFERCATNKRVPAARYYEFSILRRLGPGP